MSRFQEEWALVPTAARVIAVVAALFIVLLMGLIFLVPPMAEREAPHPLLWGFFVLTSLVPSAMMAIYVLLVGYIWADAGRRDMSPAGWTLLAIFLPAAIGIILYFILREPLPASCPSCATLVPKTQACCTSCGTALASSCPRCHQPVDPGWAHCGACGAALRPAKEAVAP